MSVQSVLAENQRVWAAAAYWGLLPTGGPTQGGQYRGTPGFGRWFGEGTALTNAPTSNPNGNGGAAGSAATPTAQDFGGLVAIVAVGLLIFW